LVSATTVWGLARTLENGLRALDKPWPGVWSNLVGLGVLVALGLAALPKWGIMGMACAVLLAQITNLLYLVLYTRSHFQVPWAFFYRVDIKSVIHAMRQLLGGFRRYAEAPVAAAGNLRALDTRK
jgi:O-antigen/teichoic acid export membrane protein